MEPTLTIIFDMDGLDGTLLMDGSIVF